MVKTRLFHGIGSLYTLAGAARKGGRRVCDEDLGRIDGAAIVECEGRIVWAGAESALPSEYKRAEVVRDAIDFCGATVIPGLVESHTHLIYDGNRAGELDRRIKGESYLSIAKSGGGILATVLATRAADEDRLAAIGQRRAERFARQGVTTIEVKSGYGLTIDSELKILRAAGRVRGPRVVRTFLGAHAVPSEFSSAEAWIDALIAEGLPRLETERLASRVDIFIEDGYFAVSLARRYLEAARARGFTLAVHADQLTRSGGARLAVELGAQSAEHLIRINEDDIFCLAASETTCVLLPTADLYMQCEYPPARALIDRGARVALATDLNPGTAPSQDVALVGVLARLAMKMTLAETLAAYTVGGAFALGLHTDIGSLEPGKACDFVVLDGSFEELFLEVGQMPIRQVFRDGRPLFAAAVL